MRINKAFISVRARDFAAQSRWWSMVLNRKWDRQPMPSCREWDLAGCIYFQVLDDPAGAGKATASFHVDHLDELVKRLKASGVDVPGPVKVDGFATLRYCRFSDPEGNEVGLLDGE